MPPLTAVASSSGGVFLLESDGRVNAPMTVFVNETCDNPHSAAQAFAGLRLFHRFLEVYAIDLPARALNGECLRSPERHSLRRMAYLPLQKIDQMSDAMLRRITSNTTVDPRDLPAANEQNTAAIRLETIAAFLDFYQREILSDAIRSPAEKDALRAAYTSTTDQVSQSVGRTSHGHHTIRSIPAHQYLRIIEELVLRPEEIFVSEGGRRSPTLMRDRAMALLAAEGFRPGAIGNFARADFLYLPGDQTSGYLQIVDNSRRRPQKTSTSTPVAKGIGSSKRQYNSRISVKLWPFTCAAIQDYIDGEREEILSKTLANRSKGLLFVTRNGQPISDRGSITLKFRALGTALTNRGLLAVSANDPFGSGSNYPFTAYVLRHSAASFYYGAKRHLPDVLDTMRLRFGWSQNSTSPSLYANRAMSDAASIDMDEFCSRLAEEVAMKRDGSSRK